MTEIFKKYFQFAKVKIEELEEHRLETWREVLKEYRRPFISLRPEDSLYDAARALTNNRVHRLPIIDPATGNVVCIVTHKRILRYLYLFVSLSILKIFSKFLLRTRNWRVFNLTNF